MTNTKRKESSIRGQRKETRVSIVHLRAVSVCTRARVLSPTSSGTSGILPWLFFFLLLSLVSLSPSETEKNTHHCSISDIIQPVLLDHSDEILAAWNIDMVVVVWQSVTYLAGWRRARNIFMTRLLYTTTAQIQIGAPCVNWKGTGLAIDCFYIFFLYYPGYSLFIFNFFVVIVLPEIAFLIFEFGAVVWHGT